MGVYGEISVCSADLVCGSVTLNSCLLCSPYCCLFHSSMAFKGKAVSSKLFRKLKVLLVSNKRAVVQDHERGCVHCVCMCVFVHMPNM